VPSSLRGARLTGPRAAAAGLLIVVLVAAVGFGARVALARAASKPEPVSTTHSSSGVVQRGGGGAAFASSATGSVGGAGSGGTAGSGGMAGSGGGGPPTSATVTVHVVGQVAREGVVALPIGARVSDALRKAGGATKGADLEALNLARVLVDGEQIRVPKPGEVLAPAPGGPSTGSAGGSGASAGGGQVNLNQATAAQLEELPGVGPVLAQRIVDWRTEHGRFTSVDELGEVSGIGEKIFAQLQPKVTV
jgi:competence protein ComEA